jgi:hypothetical protein
MKNMRGFKWRGKVSLFVWDFAECNADCDGGGRGGRVCVYGEGG